MADGTDNPSNGQEPVLPPNPPEQEYPVDRLKARLGGVLAGKPLAVYLVLVAGAATLIVLLVIVWISATSGTNDPHPICTTISTADARTAILGGRVTRINVLVNSDNPSDTLTGMNLDLNDGSCRATTQGADVRNDLYMLFGAASFYNEFAENRVRIQIQKQAIQPELLATSTATATMTPGKTATPVETAVPAITPKPTEVLSPTIAPTQKPETPAPTRTMEPTVKIVAPPASEVASPRTVPTLSPVHEPSRTPTP